MKNMGLQKASEMYGILRMKYRILGGRFLSEKHSYTKAFVESLVLDIAL